MKNKHHFHWLVAFLSIAVLSGCATAFEKEAFNAELYKDVNDIGLLTIQMPEKAMVHMAAHPGQSFGLIGGLVAAADMSSKTTRYNKAMDELDFEYQEYFRESVKTSFTNAGFNVSDVLVEREDKNVFMTSYPEDTNTHGLLDIYVYNLGYGAAGATTNYYPTLHMHARLVLPDTTETIFADKILYNNFGHRGEALLIDPDEQYAYKNFDALIEGIDGTTNGLQQAIDAVTVELVKQLRE